MTTYIVLRQSSGFPEKHWFIAGHAEAHSPDQARRKVDDTEGEFLVVPIRNASFISTTVEQQEPKVIAVEVDPSTYLDVQQTIEAEETGDETLSPEAQTA